MDILQRLGRSARNAVCDGRDDPDPAYDPAYRHRLHA